MSDRITTHLDDGICTVTFNRPEKKNALTLDMYEGLVAALQRAAQDPAIRVLLFVGSGGSFTAGNDLMDFMQNPPKGEDSPVFRFLLALVGCDKPIVAAVEGPAVGLGTTLLLHSDLVYAADTAKFHLPFVNLGLVPEGASSYLLPRISGQVAANELLLLGEPFSAARAKELGLVNQVVPAAELLPLARQKAAALSERPLGALIEAKRLLKAGTKAATLEAMKREGAVFVERLTSAEAAEAFSAFFEKRKPNFKKL